MVAKKNRINQMEMADCGPEKAGVGGSIPSLATNVFNNLRSPLRLVLFHSVPKSNSGLQKT